MDSTFKRIVILGCVCHTDQEPRSPPHLLFPSTPDHDQIQELIPHPHPTLSLGLLSPRLTPYSLGMELLTKFPHLRLPSQEGQTGGQMARRGPLRLLQALRAPPAGEQRTGQESIPGSRKPDPRRSLAGEEQRGRAGLGTLPRTADTHGIWGTGCPWTCHKLHKQHIQNTGRCLFWGLTTGKQEMVWKLQVTEPGVQSPDPPEMRSGSRTSWMFTL